MNTRKLINKLSIDNLELFAASERNVEAYFNSNPSKEALIEHFTGRMVNERMNMVAIAEKIASSSVDTDTADLCLLAKQAQDEARHFEMVREVIEHIAGHKIDVADAIAREAAKPTAKGASLLDKYEAAEDSIALALYQFIAEGRAEVVWDKMAECIEDEFISKRYAKIARDEGFHSKIGRRSLEKLLAEASNDEWLAVEELAGKIRADLLEISNKNTALGPTDV